jgi:ubiquinone/menaquinone biosynthesis C-methylase UbiE
MSAAAAQGSFLFHCGNRRAVEAGLISVDDAGLGVRWIASADSKAESCYERILTAIRYGHSRVASSGWSDREHKRVWRSPALAPFLRPRYKCTSFSANALTWGIGHNMLKEDEIWIEHRKQFADIYDELNYSSPLQSLVMRASHKLAEKAFNDQVHFGRVLEIGAGSGEHLPFVRHDFNEYILTDLDQKILDVSKKKLAEKYDGKVKFEVQKGDSLVYPDNSFDRVVAAHVLEHIYQPHIALKEWYRVLKKDGILTILIPTDPGLAWRLGKCLGPRKNAIARGIAYDYLMALEHVNACNNLIAILRHHFPMAKEAWWPFPVPSIDLNLFFVFHATVKRSNK